MIKKAFSIITFNLLVIVSILLIVDMLVSRRALRQTFGMRFLADQQSMTLTPNQRVMFDYELFTGRYPKDQNKAWGAYEIRSDKFGSRVGNEKATDLKIPNLGIIGESNVMGMDAAIENSLQGILAERFSSKANVLNFSVPGESTLSFPEILKFHLEARNLKIDKLILGVFVDLELGDLPRIAARLETGPRAICDGIIVSQARALEIKNSRLARIWFPVEVWLRAQSNLYNMVFPPGPSPKKDKDGKFLPGQHSLSLKENPPGWTLERLEEILYKNIERTAEVAGLVPKDILVVLVPSFAEYTMHYIEEYSSELDKNFFNSSKVFWTKVAAKLKNQGYEVLDPRESIIACGEKQGKTPFVPGGHLSSVGFSCLAEESMKYVKSWDFPPTAP